jgi:pyruvate,water dikinase
MVNILWFRDCSYQNKHLVGGKCSSLGELYELSQKINFKIADGFSLTTHLFDLFVEQNHLSEKIRETLDRIDVDDIEMLEEESEKLRNSIIEGEFTEEQVDEIIKNYQELCQLYRCDDLSVAVRSSAIAEDLPTASFAGQQDTYLNITRSGLLLAIKKCFASLFNSRAISYRKRYQIGIDEVKIAVAIQKMVRSDLGSAGVAFSLDPETGFNKAIIVNSSFGLGELVVSGGIKPDEYILDKRTLTYIDSDPLIMKKLGDKSVKIIYAPTGGTTEVSTNEKEQINFSLTNDQVIVLGRVVLLLEEHYSRVLNRELGVDVEWALDGSDQNIYIIQSRPETIHSNSEKLHLRKYILDQRGQQILTGIAVGEKISSGRVKILHSLKDHQKFEKGDILVTNFTTPDFEPLMKIASGLITNKGGRTSHAAIISREFGLNCVVGCGNALDLLKDDDLVTIACHDGEVGKVYRGELAFHVEEMDLDRNLKLPIKLMLNVGNPETSFGSSLLPNSGVGLARMEFIINNHIRIHPKALIDYPNLEISVREQIYSIIGNHDNGKWYFIKRLARGISKIAAPFYPDDVIVRLSDFKSNEYRNLIGGDLYEPIEENALIGWRGASRYYSKEYEDAFALECEAIKYAREQMKMTNVIVMIPFCRTTTECQLVIEKMAQHGLVRGQNGLQIYLMCEIISNVIEADEFSPFIDGVSIGGNDLLMLTIGADRDSERLTDIATDTNRSYRRLIKMAIETYKKNGIKVGFCGNQVSSSSEFCQFLIDAGIDSISVTSDVCLQTISILGNREE